MPGTAVVRVTTTPAGVVFANRTRVLGVSLSPS
jgi:hypothetical protein